MSTKKDNKGNENLGCFITTFLIIASGIPMAVKGEGPIGTLVVVILGLIFSYYVASSLSGRN